MMISTTLAVYTRAELEEMTTVKGLRPIGKAYQIPNFCRMRKAEMIQCILLAQDEAHTATQETPLMPDPWAAANSVAELDVPATHEGEVTSTDLHAFPIFPMIVLIGCLVALCWVSFKTLQISGAILLWVCHRVWKMRLTQPLTQTHHQPGAQAAAPGQPLIPAMA